MVEKSMTDRKSEKSYPYYVVTIMWWKIQWQKSFQEKKNSMTKSKCQVPGANMLLNLICDDDR